MPRAHRTFTNIYPYHVTTHLIDGIEFDSSDLDICMKHLWKTKDKHGIDIIGYNFMNTHYHLILLTCHRRLDEAMHYYNGAVSKIYNRKNGRKGHLWRSRYYPILIKTDEQLLTCMRYVDRNPVSAKLVDDPEDWEWSSVHHYKKCCDDLLITRPAVYMMLGRCESERYRNYKRLIMTPIPSDNIPKEWKHKK